MHQRQEVRKGGGRQGGRQAIQDGQQVWHERKCVTRQQGLQLPDCCRSRECGRRLDQAALPELGKPLGIIRPATVYSP